MSSKKSSDDSERSASESDREESESGSDSEGESNSKKKGPSTSGLKRYKKRFAFNEDEGNTDTWESKMKPQAFKRAVTTVSEDFKHVCAVYAYAYGGGTDKSWDKKHAKAYLAEALNRLELLAKYQRYKPETKKSAGNEGGTNELKKTFFVFQNVGDWINQINMGNGLTSLMCHMKKNPSKTKDQKSTDNPKIKAYLPDINTFIEMANKKLPDDAQTKFSEIYALNFIHAPGFIEGEAVSKDSYHFAMSGDMADPTDTNLMRMMEIRNAYVAAHNEDSKEQLPELTTGEVARMAIPQRATLGGKKGVKVAEIFNYPITTIDGAEHKVASINSSMSTTIMTLMGHANKLHDANESALLHYDLFEKFFNGSDASYAPGASVGFWLGNTNQSFGMSKKGLNSTNMEDVAAVVLAQYPGMEAKNVDSLAERILASRGKVRTAFSMIKAGGKNKKKKMKADSESKTKTKVSFKERGSEGSAYGIKSFTATQLSHLYKIPQEFLSPESRRLVTKKTEENAEISKKIAVVQTYLTSINDIFYTYSKKHKAEKASKMKKAEKESGSKKKKSKKEKKREKRLKEANVVSPARKSGKSRAEEGSDEESEASEEQTNKSSSSSSKKGEKASSTKKGEKASSTKKAGKREKSSSTKKTSSTNERPSSSKKNARKPSAEESE